MGRKILFITTDQQRYDALGCNGGDDRPHAGRRRARRRRASTTGARTTRTSSACRRAPRCSPASTCARTAWSPTASPLPADAPSVAAHLARARRLPHGADRQGALRARRSTSTARWHENRSAARAARPGRAAASSTSSSRCTCPLGAASALRQVAARASTPSDVERLRARCCSAPRAAATPARPRSKYNPIPRELVPHRLGRRPHDRLARLARRRRRLVRAG